MGRKSIKETRRLEIVKIFYKVAKKIGLENCSIAKIATVMDINPSLVIHYFKTKEELTLALIEYILEKYSLMFQYAETDTYAEIKNTLHKMINDLFSQKWNRLFDDGLFYSCYALTFRERKVKAMYKDLTDMLRSKLESLIELCNEHKITNIAEPRVTTDLIFALVDGAYFYLSVASTAKDFEQKISIYKQQTYKLLNIEAVA